MALVDNAMYDKHKQCVACPLSLRSKAGEWFDLVVQFEFDCWVIGASMSMLLKHRVDWG